MGFFILISHMVDYAAKVWLLCCLVREPSLRVHFNALAAVHIAAHLHSAYVLCRGIARVPRYAVLAITLCIGIVTPLMQVVFLCNAFTGRWNSQDGRRRLLLRLVPFDTILEGLAFLLATLHLHLSLVLGRFGSPSCTSLWQFKALLLLTLATSLLAVSINLVLWDSTVSLKLARDAYGWPGVPGGGNWSTGLVAAHLVLRSTEVVGRAVLLAVLLVLLRPSYVAAYLVIGYCINLVVLISASPHKARLQHLDSAAMLGWPLLFANLPQFVDCPKHAAAAHSAAGIMCGLRTLELTLALSAGIAVGVVEAWHEADDGRHGKQAFTLALDPHELRVLYHRSGIIVWSSASLRTMLVRP